MIVIMKPGATPEQVEVVVTRIKKEGLDVQVNQGKEQVVIGLKGDTPHPRCCFSQLRGCRRCHSDLKHLQIDLS